MTAIALVHTEEGFVIAADGRLRLLYEDYETAFGQEAGWSEQKIFRGVFGAADIAWAVSGQVYSPGRRFNLIKEIREAISAASATDSQGASLRVATFASSLHLSLSELQTKKTVFFPDRETPLATILIAGYFGIRGTPMFTVAQFYHQNGEWSEPEIWTRVHPPLETAIGSREIHERYAGKHNDTRFREHFHPSGPKLEDGLAFTKGYIEACCDPLAETIDPGIRDRIGGHIHAAAVTPSGFQWLIEPKPEGTA